MNQNGPLLPFILISGLIDSINPCAISVLLIFIGLMFTLQKSRQAIFALGITYIIAIYLTYLAIGLGILKVMHLFDVPHLMAYIGAGVLIAVGLWALKDYFFPKSFQILTIPLKSRQKIADWANKATLPAAAVTGILVGLTEFPCTGAVYVAAIGLLSAKATFIIGLIYLLIYNLMFILPLIVIFLIATNRLVMEKMLFFNEVNSKKIRLISALVMITMGVGIIIYFN